MALTESSMVPLGSPLPDFRLPDTDGTYYSNDDFLDRPILVMFICNHCPYVKHIANELSLLSRDFAQARLGMVAIQSNDIDGYPEDRPELMHAEKEARDYRFPYLYDESQDVARSFQATCTPDFFLYDSEQRLVYRGRIDETRPTRIDSGVYDSTGQEPHGRDLRGAISAAIQGNSVNAHQFPSVGCNIKWKPSANPSA
ncbi:thioredoxin family protein [Mariniblastus sp.]|jgi:peroxiredoxin|nr:thioredoxin family protein [Mariniblastus sp.]MDA7903785.1 thioredoxin family protein [Mariniblastus sp.]MDB4357516.1 thioredoxin family protein [Mariniblastus sp.]MDC0293932.1 thioredoxin family protein [Mariniblastus sp.]